MEVNDMEPLPFRALWSIEPWGVLCFDSTDGFRLWRATDWLRHRGGMRAHYDDLATTRTVIVDHLEFVPNARPGLDYDGLGRRFARVTLAMAVGIAFSRDEGADEPYLRRCFSRDTAERVMDALHALERELKHNPSLPCKSTADLRVATIIRTDNVIVIQ
jgi:hypothetical protein